MSTADVDLSSNLPSKVNSDSFSSRREPTMVVAAANMLLRHRRLILLVSLTLTTITAGVVLSAERTFTSTTAFMPQSGAANVAGLSTLAAQFGVNVGKEDPTHSPDFYTELLKSRDVLTSIAQAQYKVRTASGEVRGSALEVLDLGKAQGVSRLEAALKRLKGMIFASINRQTRVVHVDVKTPNADFSEQIANRLLLELDEFNSRLRQSRASAEEKFLREREEESKRAQVAAEERLVSFLQRNRDYQSSPSLVYQYAVLDREARQRSEVTSSLVQAAAQARIEAARNTPVLAVLDRPNHPPRPDGRGLLLSLVLGATSGIAVGIVMALLKDALTNREPSDDVHEFARLRAEALSDLRNPLQMITGRKTATEPIT